MMDIGKDLQDAYERGRQDAWDIAQKVFNSTVTLYEAEDVAKQIAKDESQNHNDEITEMVESQSETEIIIEMALNNCKTKHNGCENCDTECMWRDKPQTDDGRAFIKRHGLRVDYGDEVPYDLKPFIDW